MSKKVKVVIKDYACVENKGKPVKGEYLCSASEAERLAEMLKVAEYIPVASRIEAEDLTVEEEVETKTSTETEQTSPGITGTAQSEKKEPVKSKAKSAKKQNSK
ncbi:MAG: hypothetical protein K9I99_03840 [Melioribacteraceae bacterium]|nr:hypothetical protein [Melioribacteraceae bacterium]MCF8414557.1 hypothetical protein [Melioribacteraceae bacterium]